MPPISVVTSGDLVFRGLSTTGTSALFDDLGSTHGTFVGGLDIMQEMQAEGELQALLEATAKGSVAAAAAAAAAAKA